jgi:hypothetical protein
VDKSPQRVKYKKISKISKKTRRGKFSEISGIFRISEIPKFGNFSEIFRKFRKFRRIPEIVPGKSSIFGVFTSDYSLKPGKNPRTFPPKSQGNSGRSGNFENPGKFRKFRENFGNVVNLYFIE